jgi:hypothetical protein
VPYVLDASQKRMWVMKFDIYAQELDNVDPGSKKVQTSGASATAIRTNVPGRIQSRSENSKVIRGLGRSNEDQADTTDSLRVHLEEELLDGWFVQNVTPADEEFGSWFVIKGDAKIHRKLKHRVYSVGRTTRPAGIPT